MAAIGLAIKWIWGNRDFWQQHWLSRFGIFILVRRRPITSSHFVSAKSSCNILRSMDRRSGLHTRQSLKSNPATAGYLRYITQHKNIIMLDFGDRLSGLHACSHTHRAAKMKYVDNCCTLKRYQAISFETLLCPYVDHCVLCLYPFGDFMY